MGNVNLAEAQVIVDFWKKEEAEYIREHIDTDEFFQKTLPNAIADEIPKSIECLREMRRKIFAEYQLAAKKGVPFSERRGMIDENKVALIDETGKRLASLACSYKIKPFKSWYQPHDYMLIRACGLQWYVRVFLFELIEQS